MRGEFENYGVHGKHRELPQYLQDAGSDKYTYLFDNPCIRCRKLSQSMVTLNKYLGICGGVIEID